MFKISQIEENKKCADCNSESSYVACHFGIFICDRCANLHRAIFPDYLVKSITEPHFTEEEFSDAGQIGNKLSNLRYEYHIPECYKRPEYNTDAIFLMEQFIRAKYIRMEFSEGEKPSYTSGKKEGYLWKRGKDDKHFKKRRFILNVKENTIKYFDKEGSNIAKATLFVDKTEIVFAPEKIGNPCGFQLLFEQGGFIRSIFLYADDAEELVSWYTAIHSAKLQWLQIAFPCTPFEELKVLLWQPIIKEGWLLKAGPRDTDAYRRRWMCLVGRRLLYYVDPLDAFAKGEVFIGSNKSLYSVTADAFSSTSPFIFYLKTPNRTFKIEADSIASLNSWCDAIDQVINTPVTPQEQKLSLSKKRNSILRTSKNLFKS